MNPYSDVASNMLLKDRVYNTLKNEIILGHLKPGQVLNIYELSAKMNISGTSRPPLRSTDSSSARYFLPVA